MCLLSLLFGAPKKSRPDDEDEIAWEEDAISMLEEEEDY